MLWVIIHCGHHGVHGNEEHLGVQHPWKTAQARSGLPVVSCAQYIPTRSIADHDPDEPSLLVSNHPF